MSVHQMPSVRLHPDVVEALRLLDLLPDGLHHGAWRNAATGKLGQPITRDDMKRAVVEGKYTLKEIRIHVGMMLRALAGVS
jgi:hypothetical protein